MDPHQYAVSIVETSADVGLCQWGRWDHVVDSRVGRCPSRRCRISVSGWCSGLCTLERGFLLLVICRFKVHILTFVLGRPLEDTKSGEERAWLNCEAKLVVSVRRVQLQTPPDAVLGRTIKCMIHRRSTGVSFADQKPAGENPDKLNYLLIILHGLLDWVRVRE